MTWADLNPEYPADTINLYGPGTDSGTFDFFVETILGEDEIREDFTPSEDDNVLVEGVAGDINALGYFGLAYYEANQDSLNAVAVDNGDGNCVAPSPETVQDGTYAPLSRPLYVYVKAGSLQRPEVQEFVRFYLSEAPALAAEVGYVASPDETYAEDMAKLRGRDNRQRHARQRGGSDAGCLSTSRLGSTGVAPPGDTCPREAV